MPGLIGIRVSGFGLRVQGLGLRSSGLDVVFRKSFCALADVPALGITGCVESFSSSLLLSSLELSDTQVYPTQIRALLGTASHFCQVVVLKLRTWSNAVDFIVKSRGRGYQWRMKVGFIGSWSRKAGFTGLWFRVLGWKFCFARGPPCARGCAWFNTKT